MGFNTSRFVLLFSTLVLVVGCHRPLKDQTKVSISFPSNLGKLGQQATGNPVTYSLLCLVVSVKGTGITNTAPVSCDVGKGQIVGSKPPGTDIVIDDLTAGDGFSFDVYGLLRTNATDPCPVVTVTNWNWPLNKIYYLGGVTKQTLTAPATAITIPVTLPDVSNNLVTSANMPVACNPATQTTSAGRAVLGSQVLTGSSHKMYGKVGYKTDLQNLVGTTYRMQVWKASLQ